MNNRKNLNIEKETTGEKIKNNTKKYKQSKKRNHQERKKDKTNWTYSSRRHCMARGLAN
jgi:hypothetical protein